MRKLILALAVACLAAVGPQATQVVMVKFAGHPEEPCTFAYTGNLVYGQYSDWLWNESHEQEWLTGTDVWGWWALPHDTFYYCQVGGQFPVNCNSQLINQDVRTLSAPYFDMSAQDLVVIYIPSFGGGKGGGGIVYADCFNNPSDLYTLKHEGGHAQGLMHSGSWSCPSADVGEDYLHAIDSTDGCLWSIYGDSFSIMGFNINAQHYSVWEQDLLGWKQPSNIQYVGQNGAFTLLRSDIATTGVQDIRIPISLDGGYYYTIEYNPDVGVLVRLKVAYAFGPDFTGILNGTYPDPWNHPQAITFANPFYDPYRRIEVSLVASDANSATISILFDAAGGSACRPRGRKPRIR